MSYAPDHQDWKPVVLRRTLTKQEKIQQGEGVVEKRVMAGKNNATKNVNARKIEDDENYRPPTVTFDLKMQIQQARSKKNWTQAELAQKCNLPVNVIQNYERGTGVVDTNHLNKLNNVLGVKLARPKAKKTLSQDAEMEID